MSSAEPSIAVIIPAYNAGRYLREAVASALDQTRPPDEIVIVDDGSTDDTAAIAAAHGPPVKLVLQPHSGASAARNRGMRESRANFIAFLDADDLWAPHKLALQLAAFQTDPSLDLVFGLVHQFVSPDLSDAEKAQLRGDGQVAQGVFGGTLLARREACARVGEFDPAWQIGDFADWYARALALGAKIHVVPDIVLHRRLHNDNMTRRLRQQRSDYVRILKVNLDRKRGAAS